MTADQIRDDVLAIHKPVPTWTDSTYDETGIQTEQNALYDAAGELIAAPDYQLVCDACAPRCGTPWPCPTARAVGVTE